MLKLCFNTKDEVIPYVAIIIVVTAVSAAMLDPFSAVISALLAAAMLAIAWIDWHHFIIPDILSLPMIPAGLIATMLLSESLAISQQAFIHHGASAMLGMAGFWIIRAAYQILRGREGLGLGDVKLMGVAGAWTGLSGLSHVLLLACLTALCSIFFVSFVQRKPISRTTRLAFGVYLAPAIWLVWFHNEYLRHGFQ